MLSRREVLIASAALPFTAAYAEVDPFAALEAAHGGRLGVAVLDLGSGRRMGHRADERFPMCSTFKLPLVGLILRRVDRGRENLNRRISYGARLFPNGDFYAPITRAHLSEGSMSVDALCAAAIEWSDNGAANLLLQSAGGPACVTAFARSLGDGIARLDRMEPALNTSIPGDPRDTTSPAAMLHDLQHLAFGNALAPASRARLIGWMQQCKTAAPRIPAGLPKGWRSGDKTGSGRNGSTNDVAILWPPGERKPILVAAYYTGWRATEAMREAVLAEVGRIVSRVF